MIGHRTAEEWAALSPEMRETVLLSHIRKLENRIAKRTEGLVKLTERVEPHEKAENDAESFPTGFPPTSIWPMSTAGLPESFEPFPVRYRLAGIRARHELPQLRFDPSELPPYASSDIDIYMDRLEDIRRSVAGSDPGGDVVYLLRAGASGPWKIGASTERGLRRRIGELQTASPAKLELWSQCAAPEPGFDRAIHSLLPESERMHGEWFTLGVVSWAALAHVGLVDHDSTIPRIPDIRRLVDAFRWLAGTDCPAFKPREGE